MTDYPEPVQQLHDAIQRLPGVADIELGIQGLEGITPRDLSLPGEFGDLPHVALMRSEGGLENEILVTAEIRAEPNRNGWIAVEFLAWWVRDLSRSGEMVQMRPLALPPVAYDIQLGRTLKFVIEFFFINPGEDNTPVLEQIGDHAHSLGESIERYAEALENPSDADADITDADTDTVMSAAENGHAEAQCELAQRYRFGEGVEESPEAAFHWYSQSAEQEFPPAVMFVGYCYAHGIGVESDAARAVDYYRQAAEAGFPFAMGMLGQCYESGEGVDPDDTEAAKWYRIAAEAGEPTCQAQLGECYEYGRGVEQDLNQALELYREAFEQGLDAVEEAIERIEEQL